MNAPAIKINKPVRELVSSEEWDARVNLAACYRLMAEFGMVEMALNHISARVPGTVNEFLINPFGMLYEEMTASSMIRIDLNGNVLFNATDYGVNQAGYVIHSAIHGARHDVDCVIHTHTLAGMAVSAMKCGILPIAQTSMRFSDVGWHDFEGVALRIDERERLVRNLGDREAMVLRNHGLLTVGASIPECFNNMYRLERTCQLQVTALSCNTELRLPPDEVVRFTNEQLRSGSRRHGLLEWPALLRKLDRVDPSYRD
ncbi:MAG TPA: class II aldolase/adducin family protein [Burkholderiales bacterium]|nr:class II aldolase/adducin family protein [Burkholderiales bacterium]